jgi:hypothetical protein
MPTGVAVSAGLSLALVAVIGAVAISDPEPCRRCQEPANSGLCHSEHCQSEVLPVLRESSLKKDTHSGKWYEPVATRAERTNAADHALLMARQAEKHLGRMGRAVAGEHTRSRHRGSHRRAAA